jgi:indolepyruvate ferredoxin oxidoreductase
MKIDPRFTQEEGSAIFTGNELLVKGALETSGGVHLMTGYPGSPIAGFFDTLENIGSLLDEKGVVAKIASNEALSAAMVNGAQTVGCRAITAFKNVGLHVASDALALGTLAGTHGVSGGLIIVGDDPWSDSTQVPADSRYMAEHLRLPLIEPSSPQEVKDWMDAAFQIGRAGGIYIGYLMTVSTADGGGSVECYPNHFPELNQHQKTALSYERDIEPTLDQSVLLPPRSWRREQQMESQFAKVKDEARRLGVNRIVNAPQKDERVPLGFIASGNGYSYLLHALAELGLTGQLPILKLGMPYPVDDKLTIEFAKQCERIVVIEERRSFVEKQVLEILNGLRQSGQINTEIYGKKFPKPHHGIPATRGLNPSVVMERIIPLLQHHPSLPAELVNGKLTEELNRLQRTGQFKVSVPARTPTFCPGCPHRDSSSVLLELRKDFLDPEYMLREHKRKPVDLVAHGDTGCYTMLMFEPNKPLMHNYSGMGLGGATGAGVDPFVENKQLVFMGDGTFHHSGQTAIAHSIYNGQDITYIILDNKTTAMTGHQTHAGLEEGLTGEQLNALEIERIIKGTVPKHLEKDVRIVRINPADRDRYRQLMEQTVLADGVKIVIADKECAITYHRRVKKEERQQVKEKGYLPKKTYMNVATEVCEFCLECTNQTGCPGLKIEDTDYGPKIQTDLSWCVNDGACERINACPSFEEVTVQRKGPKRMGDEHVHLDDIPEPPRPIHADQEAWRCYLAGVGGMGIGLCTAILCTAGHEMGYHVQFLDKKGLAIRNGGVFSQLVFTRRDSGDHMSDPVLRPGSAVQHTPDRSPPTTPLIPYGKADLLLGVDILEATRALDPNQQYRVASPEHTAAVVNTAKTPTVLTLMGEDDFKIEDMENTLKRYTNVERFMGFNVGDLCERMLDTKLYANIMMLGMAFQNGYLPLTHEAIENAIGKVTRGEKDRNMRAFNIGRKIAVRPELFVVEYQKDVETARKCLRRKLNTMRAWFGGRKGERLARQFRVLMKQTFRATRGLRVDDELMRDVIIRAYDCAIWGGIDYARRYCYRLVDVFHKDEPEQDYAITRQVVWRLAQCMLIKDEVYVAAMLTSPEKYKRDRRRFNVNTAHGDKIIYKHHNRPEFEIFGRKIQFEWKSRDWQLRLMARARFLRRVLPGWHSREREFRDWYEQLVDQLQIRNRRDYERWLQILSTPGEVTGFRDIRYPKMERARQRAEQLLATDPEDIELPEEREARQQQEADSRVRLPILEGAGV